MSFQRLISVAPMMDCTDKHDRYFLRLISPDVLLYTEMITAHALRYGDAASLLAFNEEEHPLALQLGGHDPAMLADAAKLGAEFGYDEINLNVGCPSSRVKSGKFGACLMLEPALVAECVAAMRSVVSVPVTVKCRIGVDQQDSYEQLCHFIETVKQAGCEVFIIHARVALLSGLSPKQNRQIPPLRYDYVKQIKQDFPELTIILNGSIQSVGDIRQALTYVDGVMIGRAAYSNPYLLAEIQSEWFRPQRDSERSIIIQKLIPYISTQLLNGVKLSAISRHILGLFQGQVGAAKWRRYISENAYRHGSGVEVIEQALSLVNNININARNNNEHF